MVELIARRGTPEFGELSRRLYGGTADRFHAGAPTLADLGRAMAAMLDNLASETLVARERPTLDAAQTVHILTEGLTRFSTTRRRFASSCPTASSPTPPPAAITSRSAATPASRRAGVRLLQVHSGLPVHLGTTLNGQSQPVCTFLGKGPPSATTTQEGLAVLTEVLAFASHPADCGG